MCLDLLMMVLEHTGKHVVSNESLLKVFSKQIIPTLTQMLGHIVEQSNDCTMAIKVTKSTWMSLDLLAGVNEVDSEAWFNFAL